MELSLSNSYILTRVGSHEQRSMRVTSSVSSVITLAELNAKKSESYGIKLAPWTWLGLTPLIGHHRDTVQYLLCYKQTNIQTNLTSLHGSEMSYEDFKIAN